jgi:hypothetical protein
MIKFNRTALISISSALLTAGVMGTAMACSSTANPTPAPTSNGPVLPPNPRPVQDPPVVVIPENNIPTITQGPAPIEANPRPLNDPPVVVETLPPITSDAPPIVRNPRPVKPAPVVVTPPTTCN